MIARLLIVDDELEIREMLARHFRLIGYQTNTAADGMAALDVLASSTIDIVISDIRMPRMDGTELCKRIRIDFPMVRIIMITGYVTLENGMACLRRGADDCIFKPFEDLCELEAAVTRSAQTLQRWKKVIHKLAEHRPSEVM